MSIAKYLEHTLLKPEATVTDIMKLCAEAKEYNLGGVCVNTCYAGLARHLLTGTDVKIVTVVGFPLGADRSEVKALATKLAVDEDHVDEVDMVMNMSAFKAVGGRGPKSPPESFSAPASFKWCSAVISSKSSAINFSFTSFFRRTAFVTLSIMPPAASRKEAEPLNTGVTKVLSTLSSSNFVACSFTS